MYLLYLYIQLLIVIFTFQILDIYCQVFGDEYPLVRETPSLVMTEGSVHLGRVTLQRVSGCSKRDDLMNGESLNISTKRLNHLSDSNENLLVLRSQLTQLSSIALCVEKNWMPILVGISFILSIPCCICCDDIWKYAN